MGIIQVNTSANPAFICDGAWQDLVLAAGVTQAGAGFEPLQARIRANGDIEMRGVFLLDQAAINAAIAAGYAIATMPDANMNGAGPNVNTLNVPAFDYGGSGEITSRAPGIVYTPLVGQSLLLQLSSTGAYTAGVTNFLLDGLQWSNEA